MPRLRLKKLPLLAAILLATSLTACSDLTGPSANPALQKFDASGVILAPSPTKTPIRSPIKTPVKPDSGRVQSSGINVWA